MTASLVLRVLGWIEVVANGWGMNFWPVHWFCSISDSLTHFSMTVKEAQYENHIGKKPIQCWQHLCPIDVFSGGLRKMKKKLSRFITSIPAMKCVCGDNRHQITKIRVFVVIKYTQNLMIDLKRKLRMKETLAFFPLFNRIWNALTDNYGNIMPVDWSQSRTRSLHLPTLNLDEKSVSTLCPT